MVTLNSCHTVSAGALQEFKLILAFFLLTLGAPKLRDVCVLGSERNREQLLSETPLAHLFMSLCCLCCRNRSESICDPVFMLCWADVLLPAGGADPLAVHRGGCHRQLGATLAGCPERVGVAAPVPGGCHPCSASSPLLCCRQQARHHWDAPECTGFAKPHLGAPGTCLKETARWATCRRWCVFQNPS